MNCNVCARGHSLSFVLMAVDWLSCWLLKVWFSTHLDVRLAVSHKAHLFLGFYGETCDFSCHLLGGHCTVINGPDFNIIKRFSKNRNISRIVTLWGWEIKRRNVINKMAQVDLRDATLPSKSIRRRRRSNILKTINMNDLRKKEGNIYETLSKNKQTKTWIWL